MKKWIVLCACLCAVVAGAEEGRGPRWEIDLGAGTALAVTSAYATAGVAASYKPRTLGIGVGAKGWLGLPRTDIYTAAFARLDIWWFYLNAGVALPLKGPREEPGYVYTTPVAGPYLCVGIARGFIRMGPGKLGLDLGAEAFFTSIGVEPGEDVGSAVGAGIGAVILSLFGAVKVHAGLLYELRL